MTKRRTVERRPRQFRLINAVGAAVVLAGAVAPVVVLPLWRRPAFRPVLLAACWLVAVGCAMHAVIDGIQRVLRLTVGRQRRGGHRHPWLPSAFAEIGHSLAER